MKKDNKTEELLSCPFCGGNAELVNDDTLVSCVDDDCPMSGSWSYKTKESAIKAWNTRPTTPNNAQLIGEVIKKHADTADRFTGVTQVIEVRWIEEALTNSKDNWQPLPQPPIGE